MLREIVNRSASPQARTRAARHRGEYGDEGLHQGRDPRSCRPAGSPELGKGIPAGADPWLAAGLRPGPWPQLHFTAARVFDCSTRSPAIPKTSTLPGRMRRPRTTSPALVRSVERDFIAEAYEVDSRIRDEHAVDSAFIRFPGLLHELGLSAQRTEVTAIKIEIDTHPPAGARCTTTLVRRHVTVNIFHHDRATLLAGKLHAILQRPFVKGRDLYDLFWYLGDRAWPGPNLEMLSNALARSGWKGAGGGHGKLAKPGGVPIGRNRLESRDRGRSAFHRKAVRPQALDAREHAAAAGGARLTRRFRAGARFPPGCGGRPGVRFQTGVRAPSRGSACSSRRFSMRV